MATATDRKDSKSSRKPRKNSCKEVSTCKNSCKEVSTCKKVKQFSYTCQICGTTVTSEEKLTACCACGADSLTQLHEPLYIEPIDIQKDNSLRLARVLFKLVSITALLGTIAAIATTLIRVFN